jgi:hypothetical protein
VARRTFARTRDGSLHVELSVQEADLLVMTARDMSTLVEDPPDDAVRDRLYPRAYLDPTEESAQQEFDAVVHGELVGARKRAFESIASRLEAAEPNRRGVVELTLGSEEEAQWLTGVNDARLVIGTALGVTEDGDTDYERDDPRFEYGVLYGWLTALHFELVSLLLDEIGEGGTDDAASF